MKGNMMNRTRTLIRSGLALIVGLATIAALPTTASAQTSGFGYVIGGPVAVSNVGIRDSTPAWHAGGGGEAFTSRHVGVGGELGFMYFPAFETTSGSGHVSHTDAYLAGLLSFNTSYHFGDPSRATRPFVTGGFSFLTGGEPIALWNVAGGVDWWLGRHAGLRLEVRDQLAATPAFLGFRVGVLFR